MSWTTVFAVAERQNGVVARWQALDGGVAPSTFDDRRERERWRKVARGVYLLPGVPFDPLARTTAEVLAAGRDALATAESALWLRSIVDRPPPRVEIVRGSDRGSRRRAGNDRRRSRTLEPADREVVRGVPCATVARAFLDLAARYPIARIRARALDAAQRGIDLAPVVARAARARGATGRPALLSTLLSIVPERADSILADLVHDRLIASGFTPDAVPVAVDVGDRFLHPDVTFAPRCVGIESDGLSFHRERRHLELDHRKTNAYIRVGWAVLRIDWGRFDQDWDGFCGELTAVLDDRVPQGRHAGVQAHDPWGT